MVNTEDEEKGEEERKGEEKVVGYIFGILMRRFVDGLTREYAQMERVRRPWLSKGWVSSPEHSDGQGQDGDENGEHEHITWAGEKGTKRVR